MLKAIKDSSPAVLAVRILIAAMVVFATYNPTGNSVFHWVTNSLDGGMPDAWVVLGAIVAILINVVLLIAAWKALGKVGIIIVLILFAALVYLALQEGVVFWRRATGQVVTDEADDVRD